MKTVAPIRNPSNRAQRFDVLEVWGHIYKGDYRMRFIYAQTQKECVLMGQEILEYARSLDRGLHEASARGMRRGRIKCSVRVWMRPHVKVGGHYPMDDGRIVVDSIEAIEMRDITHDLARNPDSRAWTTCSRSHATARVTTSISFAFTTWRPAAGTRDDCAARGEHERHAVIARPD